MKKLFISTVISGVAAVTLSGCSGNSTGASAAVSRNDTSRQGDGPGLDLRPLSTASATPESLVFTAGLDKDGLTMTGGPTGSISPNGFYAVAGFCTGSADGHCGAVVFFAKGNPVGSVDTHNPSDVRFVSENGTDVVLDLPIYKGSDPLCCPSGGAQTIDFRWNGSKVVVLSSTPGPAPVVGREPQPPSAR